MSGSERRPRLASLAPAVRGTRALLLGGALALATGGFACGGEEGPAERTGREIDEAVEETEGALERLGREADQALDEAGERAEEAAEELEEAAEEVGDAVRGSNSD